MSCSKPETTVRKPTPPTRMYKPPRDSVTKMLTPLGYPYITEDFYFMIEEADEKKLYAFLNFKALNKKDEMKTTMISVWEILCNVVEDMSPMRTKQDEKLLIDETVVHLIRCRTTIDWILKQDKAQIGMPFTSNDPGMMSSFRPGFRNGQCNEQLVMCLGKTAFSEACCAKNPMIPYNVAMTSPRCSPDMLDAVLERKGNDTRFIEKAVPLSLNNEERKDLKKERLAGIRLKIEAMGAERFCELYLAWLQRNKTLEKDTDPVVFKDKIGGNILMDHEMVETWGRLAPLLFIFATSKTWLENPANFAVAVTCDRQTCIAEVTPKDERYGVKPPDGKDLSWCAETLEGAHWLVKMLEKHGQEQEAFIARLQDVCETANGCRIGNRELHAQMVAEALEMLTDGLNQYKFGILGLTKAIVLAIGRDEIVLPTDAHRRIKEFLTENGLGRWWLRVPILELDEDDRAPFEVVRSVGSEAVALPA